MPKHTLTDIVTNFKNKPLGYIFKLYSTVGLWQLKSKDNDLFVLQNTITMQVLTTTMQQQIF